jgi:hypothetical protein
MRAIMIPVIRRKGGEETMKGIVSTLNTSTIFFGSTALWACPECRPLVKSGIYNQDFAGNLVVLLLPIAVLLAIGFGIYFADTLKSRLCKRAETWRTTYNAAR